MKKMYLLFPFLLLFMSCFTFDISLKDGFHLYMEKGDYIYPGKVMFFTEKKHLQKIGLLDSDEKVIFFSRSSDYKQSGAFFSEKRVASYWTAKYHKDKNYIESVQYNEIHDITVKYNRGLTWATSIQVTRKDSSHFKLYINGSQESEEIFFNELIKIWKEKKDL